MTGYDCFFIGGPHHNSTMHVRSNAKPSSSWGSLVPELSRSGGPGPAFVSYGIYTHEATIEGYDHGIAASGIEARPLAIYVWRGDDKQTERP